MPGAIFYTPSDRRATMEISDTGPGYYGIDVTAWDGPQTDDNDGIY
jgi:hypothetical protein